MTEGRTSPLTVDTLERLKALLGPGGYLDRADEIAPFLRDFRGLYRGASPLVALPDSTAQVSSLVRFCSEHRIAIVPHGGNTSYCGGATPDQAGRAIVLSLRRMRGIRELDAANYSITVEAGCVLAAVHTAAESADRLFPLSLGSEGSCTVGGTLSTNAGGTAVLRYGMMRDLTLGLEVVLPDGRVLDQLRTLRKDNTGYDLKQLFIGAEGTLGVITAACLRLFPRPRGYATALVALDSPAAAVELLGHLRGALGDSLTTFELMPRIAIELTCRYIEGVADPLDGAFPWYVLAEVSLPQSDSDLSPRLETALAAGIDSGLLRDAVLAASLTQREALWKLRENIPAAQTRAGYSLKHDVSVATSQLPDFIEAGGEIVQSLLPGTQLVAYGHLGDGNLHFNVSVPAQLVAEATATRGAELRRALHDLVARRRGSFSAEHGIGQLKVDELERYEDPVTLQLMQTVKRAFDPLGIMNPGKVLRDG